MGNCIEKKDKKLKPNRRRAEGSPDSSCNRPASEYKILFLGIGDSGKSTFIKQLKNIYLKKEKLDDERKKMCRELLIKNTKDAILCLINICEKTGFDLSAFESRIQLIKDWKGYQTISQDMADLIIRLWETDEIQHAFENRNSFHVPDSAPYYFRNLHRYVEEDFDFSEEDIIMAGIRTTGFSKTSFPISPLIYTVVDVGGMRSERRKWPRIIKNADAVVYFVNLMGYQNVLSEDPAKNSLKETLEVFRALAKSKYFHDIPIFLFFSKKDLFEHFSKKKDILCVFPDYSGDFSQTSQMEFIGRKFAEKVPPNLKIQGVNYITSSFKKDVKYAFEDVKDALIKKHERNRNK